jgi:hypothetical protein
LSKNLEPPPELSPEDAPAEVYRDWNPNTKPELTHSAIVWTMNADGGRKKILLREFFDN